jgi:hypothetical protein
MEVKKTKRFAISQKEAFLDEFERDASEDFYR